MSSTRKTSAGEWAAANALDMLSSSSGSVSGSFSSLRSVDASSTRFRCCAERVSGMPLPDCCMYPYGP
jgi:hypothetical protein